MIYYLHHLLIGVYNTALITLFCAVLVSLLSILLHLSVVVCRICAILYFILIGVLLHNDANEEICEYVKKILHNLVFW